MRREDKFWSYNEIRKREIQVNESKYWTEERRSEWNRKVMAELKKQIMKTQVW